MRCAEPRRRTTSTPSCDSVSASPRLRERGDGDLVTRATSSTDRFRTCSSSPPMIGGYHWASIRMRIGG